MWHTAEDPFDKPIANANRGDTMTPYDTKQPRLQIAGLEIHEDQGDGTPRCNCWAPGKKLQHVAARHSDLRAVCPRQRRPRQQVTPKLARGRSSSVPLPSPGRDRSA